MNELRYFVTVKMRLWRWRNWNLLFSKAEIKFVIIYLSKMKMPVTCGEKLFISLLILLRASAWRIDNKNWRWDSDDVIINHIASLALSHSQYFFFVSFRHMYARYDDDALSHTCDDKSFFSFLIFVISFKAFECEREKKRRKLEL